jgi:hypothetical protein
VAVPSSLHPGAALVADVDVLPARRAAATRNILFIFASSLSWKRRKRAAAMLGEAMAVA